MDVRISTLLLFLLCCYPVFMKKCTNAAYYQETMRKTPRLSSIQLGNYSIQALLTMSVEGGNCANVSREGVVRAYALKYAIDQFNERAEYSKYATLGLQIDDVCTKLPTTMARGIEVIYFHRPNSVCRADFLTCDAISSDDAIKPMKASGVVGTGMSFTTIPLASLMSLYKIPHVSPLASSRLLSKRELYKSFFRTIPPDPNQIKAMLDIFKKLEWNYIFAVGSDDDYGKLAVAELKNKAESKEIDICITKDEYIPFQSTTKTNTKVESVVQKIANEPKAKVVVLFLYVVGLGDLILKEAKKKGINRIWFTSETWHPVASIEFSKPKYLPPQITNTSRGLLDQTHGILTVALKKYPMHYLIDYTRKQIKTDWECNVWLKNYLEKSAFQCKPINMTATYDIICKDGKNVTLKAIMNDLRSLPGNPDRIIDAARSIGEAIYKAIKKKCGEVPCTLKELPTSDITAEMFNTSFTNEQGQQISFDYYGNPKTAFYSIENLVYNKAMGKLEYVTVGNWSFTNTSNKPAILNLDTESIQWPYWFNNSHLKTDNSGWVNVSVPVSVCTDKCEPSFRVVGKAVGQCCWECEECKGNNHTNIQMSPVCIPCGKYHYTVDNINCIRTPMKWLTIDDPAGLSVVIISCLGLLCSFGIIIFMIRYWPLVTVTEKSPHLLTFVCILLVVTFAYGPLHILKPTEEFCAVRNGYFFVMLMIYTSFTVTKTQAMKSSIQYYCDKIFCGNMTATQLVVLLLFALLEIGSIIAWFFLNEKQLKEFRNIDRLIQIQCSVDFTAARLVSTFIPCIILIIGTFCSFRERNSDHSFYEPKFLSFSCIALCIIIVAFLPTFKYVDGIYQAVVLAFTMNVFGFTFIACFILPKIYVGIARKNRGIDEYPIKPGISKKEKKEQKGKKKAEKEAKKKKKMEEQQKKLPIDKTISSSSYKTRSTVEDTISEVDKGSTETALDAVKIEEKEENGGEKIQNAYSNETFDSDENVYTDAPPRNDGNVEEGHYESIDDNHYEGIDEGEEGEGDYEAIVAGDSPPPSYESSVLSNDMKRIPDAVNA